MSRYFNSNILIFLLLLSPFSNGIELTSRQWQQLQSQKLELSPDYLVKSDLDSNSAENIFLVSKLIKSFSEKNNLTAKQIHQLNKWRRSDAQIAVQSQSNSQNVAVVVDISEEAKNALQSIRSKTIADELYQKWHNNDFNKDDLIDLQGIHNKATFIRFFNRLPSFLQTGFADWAMEQMQEAKLAASGDYNYLIAHMAKILRSKQYAQFLLEKLPVNQSGYVFLQSMHGTFEETEQLELLTSAASRPKMRTQSFNLLAQHFPDNKTVALLIASYLKDDKAYWQALTVMPAFVKVGNTQAFENVIKNLSTSKQAQVKMRLQRKN